MLGARTTEGTPYVLRGWNPAPQTECYCYGKWEVCSGVIGEATYIVFYYLKVLSSKAYDGKPLRRVAL